MSIKTLKLSPTPYSTKEEFLNTWTHGFGALAAILGLVIFVVSTVYQQQWLKLLTLSVYGISLVSLMASSSLYHHATDPAKKKQYKLYDHCAIYLLIAGTYTPLISHTVPSFAGFAVLGTVWLCAIVGIAIKIKYGSQYKKFSVATYLVMGWLSVFIIYELVQALEVMALTLLALGGLIYSSGVYFYLNHKIAYNHAIWHVFVLLAALCHYLLIYLYIL